MLLQSSLTLYRNDHMSDERLLYKHSKQRLHHKEIVYRRKIDILA